jgi:transcription termination factor NusB
VDQAVHLDLVEAADQAVRLEPAVRLDLVDQAVLQVDLVAILYFLMLYNIFQVLQFP